MHFWARSAGDGAARLAAPSPTFGQFWGSHTRQGSQTILLAETWSSTSVGPGTFAAPATIGQRGSTPGQKFGGAGGVTPFSAGRWGVVNCDLTYMRHRKRNGPGRATQPLGRVNLAYADGHVASKSNDDLVNRVTGLSTGDSRWCPGF
jgi:prepilin-type processing-associated H-X9-DG protein